MNIFKQLFVKYIAIPCKNKEVNSLKRSLIISNETINDLVLKISKANDRELELKNEIMGLGIQNTKHMEKEAEFTDHYNKLLRQMIANKDDVLKEAMHERQLIADANFVLNSFEDIMIGLKNSKEKIMCKN